MDAATRKTFEEKIRKKIARLKEDIAELEELTKPISPENSLGRITRMDAINNKSINEAALRQSREKLTKLEYALTHLDSPDYGVCRQCKSEIPMGRLLIVPESTKCVKCATR